MNNVAVASASVVLEKKQIEPRQRTSHGLPELDYSDLSIARTQINHKFVDAGLTTSEARRSSFLVTSVADDRYFKRWQGSVVAIWTRKPSMCQKKDSRSKCSPRRHSLEVLGAKSGVR